MKPCLICMCLFAVLFGAVAIFAQNPDYILDITESSGPVGGQATVATTLDVVSATQIIVAYQWGVCHESFVETAYVENGVDVMALNDGDGPDFVEIILVPGEGWTINVLINNLGAESLPPGAVYEMHLATYDLLEEGTATLTYCDSLGPLTLLQCPCSVPIFPTLETGQIQVGDPGTLFIRGDCDGNGTFNGLPDGLAALNFQFVPGAPTPPCLAQCDADGNRTFNGLIDGLHILNFQFVPGAPPIPAPFPNCGADANAIDVVGCDTPTCP